MVGGWGGNATGFCQSAAAFSDVPCTSMHVCCGVYRSACLIRMGSELRKNNEQHINYNSYVTVMNYTTRCTTVKD